MSLNTSYHAYDEINQQPAAWASALAEIDRQTPALRALFAQQQPDQLLFMGCGSPFFLARSAANLARALTGIESVAHPASDVWLFPEQTLPPGRRTLLVVFSRSGETTELMKAIEVYRARGGGAVVAATCYPNSTLAKTADITLAVPDAQEVSLAQTRSFTSMAMLAQGIIRAFGGLPISDGIRRLPALGAQIVEEQRGFAHDFGSAMSGRFERFYFLGSGALYGLACEAMLKMKEMSLSLSEAYHFMEFRHGPMSMANDRTLIIGMVSRTAAEYEAAVLSEMRGRGATALALTPQALPTASADVQIMLPGGLDDLERGVLYMPTLHQIIYAHTLAKELNPDLPNNLTAVINLDGVHHAN